MLRLSSRRSAGVSRGLQLSVRASSAFELAPPVAFDMKQSTSRPTAPKRLEISEPVDGGASLHTDALDDVNSFIVR